MYADSKRYSWKGAAVFIQLWRILQEAIVTRGQLSGVLYSEVNKYLPSLKMVEIGTWIADEK